MAGYAKVFDSLLTSSLWCHEHYVIRIWIAMLARCNQQGVVEGSIPGFASLCRVTREELEHTLEVLLAPDPDSRTPDHDGRRLEVVPGGWRILNYKAYRAKGQEKEGSKAPFMRTLREGRKAPVPPVTGGNELPAGLTSDPAAAATAEVHQPPTVSGAAAAAGPVVVALPSAKGLWSPPAELLLRWQQAWPGFDVLRGLEQIREFLAKNPKVRYGHARLVPWVEEWLAKEAQGKAGRPQARAAPSGASARPQVAQMSSPKLPRVPGGAL